MSEHVSTSRVINLPGKLKAAATPEPKPVHITPFDTLPDTAFIRQSYLVLNPKNPTTTAVLLPFSSATLWRKVKAGTFPSPSKLSAHVTAWNVGRVRAWMASHDFA